METQPCVTTERFTMSKQVNEVCCHPYSRLRIVKRRIHYHKRKIVQKQTRPASPSKALLVFIRDQLHGWEVDEPAWTLLIRPSNHILPCKHVHAATVRIGSHLSIKDSLLVQWLNKLFYFIWWGKKLKWTRVFWPSWQMAKHALNQQEYTKPNHTVLSRELSGLQLRSRPCWGSLTVQGPLPL